MRSAPQQTSHNPAWFRGVVLSIWMAWPQIWPGSPTELHFQYRGGLAPNGQIRARSVILSIWAAWPQILSEWACEVLFCTSGRPGPRRAQNGPLGFILSIWAAWSQISPEWASEASFGASGQAHPRYGQKGAQRPGCLQRSCQVRFKLELEVL